jgi:hypothetical protein
MDIWMDKRNSLFLSSLCLLIFDFEYFLVLVF